MTIKLYAFFTSKLDEDDDSPWRLVCLVVTVNYTVPVTVNRTYSSRQPYRELNVCDPGRHYPKFITFSDDFETEIMTSPNQER